MKYMQHPFSGQVQACSPLMAKRLRRYGWGYVTRKEYVEYQRATLHAAMIKNIPAAAKKLGRLQ